MISTVAAQSGGLKEGFFTMIQTMDWAMLFGQFMGIVAVILGFISFQMRTQKQLLVVQIITTIAFCLHYGFIGALSGMAMNALGIVRNIAYYHKDKKLFSGWKCPIFFGVLMAIVGVMSWQGWYSIFVLLGLIINTVCLSFSNPQNIRKSILVSSPLVLIYDLFVFAVGGTIYETVVIISSVIGIIRYGKEKNASQEA